MPGTHEAHGPDQPEYSADGQDPADPSQPEYSAKGQDPADPQPDRGDRRRRRGRRAAIISIVSVLAVFVGAVGGIYLVTNQLTGNVRRIPHVFQGLARSSRPIMPAATRSSMTILLAGSDLRSNEQTTGSNGQQLPFQPGEQRSDVLMLVHISADRKRAAFISIPRDSWVDVPGHGIMKINAAFSLGGPSLMIRTVEHLTDVFINHYAVIDFRGFESLVRALGGVDVQVARPTSSGSVNFRQGLNDLTAASAMAFVRQRDGLPLGDLSRIQRQQNLIRAILTRVASAGVLSNPIEMYHLIDAFTGALSVDSTFTNSAMRTLALQLSRLRSSDVSFLTAPWSGLGWRGEQSVVLLNSGECATLWHAVQNDSVAAWAMRHPGAVTPPVTY
ncbi:MAG TPA: LCP family protein [Streptosporangiaceae bacterium]